MSRDATKPASASNSIDDTGVVFRTVHEWDGRESLSDTVVRAVAEAAGIDPTELQVPLIDSIDPDALDALFRPRPGGTPRQADGLIAFPMNGFEVVAYADGRIVVYEPGHA